MLREIGRSGKHIRISRVTYNEAIFVSSLKNTAFFTAHTHTMLIIEIKESRYVVNFTLKEKPYF